MARAAAEGTGADPLAALVPGFAPVSVPPSAPLAAPKERKTS